MLSIILLSLHNPVARALTGRCTGASKRAARRAKGFAGFVAVIPDPRAARSLRFSYVSLTLLLRFSYASLTLTLRSNGRRISSVNAGLAKYYKIRNYRGRVSNFDQSEARKQCFLASD